MRNTDGGAAKVSPTSAGVAWTQVRDAAVSAVCRGWPVVPGTCCPDELGFSEVGPLEDTWDLAPVTDPERAHEIWTRQRSLGVLLVCGRGVDVLEVPFRVAELLPGLGLGVLVATALSPSRWLLLVATGSGTLRPELAAASVRLRGIGQWAALPPTALGGYPPIRWKQAPPDVPLPRVDEVQRVLAEALRSGPPDAHHN
jgi:Bifunctional DNA primase/polymerase, N-terminal